MIVTLSRFREHDAKVLSFIEAAEDGQIEVSVTTRSVSEDIADTDDYITKAEDLLFVSGRYIEIHPISPSPIPCDMTAGINHKISFRPITHDDCRLWFAQLYDVCSSHGIVSHVNMFTSLKDSANGRRSLRCT